ncbi:MAG: thioesterase [Thermoprotei archaeon]|nr:MAG: thioesterase [Thermoprotei archaeon]
MKSGLRPGLVCRKEFIVTPSHVAKVVGSGDVDVLSTPSMIAFMESAAMECVKNLLEPDVITVGIRVCVSHKAPVPIGEKIAVEAKLVGIDGRKLTFEVRAMFKDIVVGEGIHERYVIERSRFLEKVKNLARRRV